MRYFIALILIITSLGSYSQEIRILSLEECINIAIDNNLSIQRSRLNLETAEVDLRQAKWQRYPTVNFSGNYGHSWGRGIDPVTNLFTNQEIRFNGINGFAEVPIINGFQITNNINQSENDKNASELDLKKSENDISLSIALSYTNVIFNKELVENAKYQMESSKEQLSQTIKLVEAGSLPIFNQLQLESQLATNEVEVINAQNNLDLALLNLKQTMLLPAGDEIDIIIPEIAIDQSSIDTISINQVFNEALSTQPEIEAAELRVKSATYGVKSAKGSLYPTLSLSGQVSTNYSNANTFPTNFTSTGFDTTSLITESNELIFEPTFGFDTETTSLSRQYKDNYNRQLSVSLTIPVLNGLRATSNVQRSKINLQQAEISVIEQKNVLYQNIETAYRNAVAASKTYEARQKQVEALEETFRTVENQYNLGVSNFTDYQVANNNLFQAKSDLSRAKYDFIYRQKLLEFYLGIPLKF